MKIDKVILSSNDSKTYLDFWPIVSKAWKNIDIEPILKSSLELSLYGAGIIFDKFSLNNKEVISIRNLSSSSEDFSILIESMRELDIFALLDFERGLSFSKTYAVFILSILIWSKYLLNLIIPLSK